MNYKPVERPKRTVIVRNNNKEYVYLTREVKYSKELKCSRPNRISIGRLNDQGLLIPNKNYYEIFGESVELEIPTSRADYVSVGPHLVVNKIAENLSLYSLLESVFQNKVDKILDVATFMIMSENNVMQYFEDYGFNHSLFNGVNFTDNTIAKLLGSLTVLNRTLN